ncbi:MAG: glutathione transferase GstA [Gammaproteobacteria bacterium]
MKLYYSPGACSLAPHIILCELKASFEKIKVDLKTKTTEKDEDFSKINPKGYVPFLVLDDQSTLSEVAIILQYLADQHPEGNLIPQFGSRERYTLLEWVHFISTEIHKGFSPFFRKDTPEGYLQIAKDTLTKRLPVIANRLETQDYVMGSQFTIADAYLFTVLRWAGLVKFNLEAWPQLINYLDRIAERPSVKEAVQSEKTKIN